MNEFQRVSFLATIAFGLLALFGLLWMGLSYGVPQAAVCACFAAAAAYIAQSLFTAAALPGTSHRMLTFGRIFQFVSLALWSLGMWHVLGGLSGA